MRSWETNLQFVVVLAVKAATDLVEMSPNHRVQEHPPTRDPSLTVSRGPTHEPAMASTLRT